MSDFKTVASISFSKLSDVHIQAKEKVQLTEFIIQVEMKLLQESGN